MSIKRLQELAVATWFIGSVLALAGYAMYQSIQGVL